MKGDCCVAIYTSECKSGNGRKSGNGQRKTDERLVFFFVVKFVAGLLSKVVPPVAGAVFFLLVLIGFGEAVLTNDIVHCHCWSWNPAWWTVANGWHGGGAARRIVFEFLVAKQS